MLGSLLVGLDGSEHSRNAVDLGIRWATQSGATIFGMAVLDEPGIFHGEPVPLGGAAFKQHRDQRRLAEAQEMIQSFFAEFEQKCTATGVTHQTRLEKGIPWQRLTLAAQEFDLILIGAKTHFHFATQNNPCETLGRVVKNAPRPVVVVPDTIPDSTVTVIAFDGSLPAARAMQVFVAVGLDHIQTVHVVSIDANESIARQHAERAARFLQYQKVDAQIHAIASNAKPSEVLLEQVQKLQAGLMVMGAYGEPFLRTFLFGSATKQLLQKASIPVFVYH